MPCPGRAHMGTYRQRDEEKGMAQQSPCGQSNPSKPFRDSAGRNDLLFFIHSFLWIFPLLFCWFGFYFFRSNHKNILLNYGLALNWHKLKTVTLSTVIMHVATASISFSLSLSACLDRRLSGRYGGCVAMVWVSGIGRCRCPAVIDVWHTMAWLHINQPNDIKQNM